MTINVVPIRDTPSQADIPGMLRQLAASIEAGGFGKVEAAFVLLPVEGDYPTFFGWGHVENENAPVVQLELAKMWLLTNHAKRG